MIKKLIITAFCVLSPVIGISLMFTTSLNIFGVISDFTSGDSKQIWHGIGSLFSMILILMPMWYVWKGTKLIPFITIFPIRLIIFIVVLLCAPIGAFLSHFPGENISAAGNSIATIGSFAIIFLSLWGIWIRS